MQVTEAQLATLWPVMAAKEGHVSKMPGRDLDQIKKARKAQSAKKTTHRNTLIGRESQRKCLAAIKAGCHVGPEITRVTKLHRDTVRRSLYNLEKAGKIRRVGKAVVQGGIANVWEIAG